ncbi:MAG: hypothetical protein JW751_10795 [Polyangiaceae bacterium]|nr:hypothetical protein [Polyangiaceae bacterium]
MNLLSRLGPTATLALLVGACESGDSGCPTGWGLCSTTGQCVPSAAQCPGAPVGCPDGQTDCGGVCVDTQGSSANCGVCGNACPSGTVCSAGSCTADGCGDGLTQCGADCVNTQIHNSHCGGCDQPCTGNWLCANGSCSACVTGLTLCSGECVSLASDAGHCGSCDNACTANAICAAGVCTVPETPVTECEDHQYLCDDVCVNHSSINCGACGVVCVAGQVCTTTGCVGSTTPPVCDPTDNPTTELCDVFARTGVCCTEYLVQNNIWNEQAASQDLCISVTGTSFTVTTSGLSVGTSGAPAAYPSIVKGCHQNACSTSATSNLPLQVSAIQSATSSWTFSGGNGNYNVSYDLWVMPGSNASYDEFDGLELMIWLDYNGVQPFGNQQGTVNIGGASYAVWIGAIGWNYVAYVRQGSVSSVSNLDLKAFIDDAVSRGKAQNSWYLKAIEAGFEIWSGGQGMKTSSFSATVE